MKKKIILLFVTASLIFSIFGVFASAEDAVDVVKEEIATNYPNLDLSSVTGERCRIIGTVEDITDEFSLYVYLYVPEGLNLYYPGCYIGNFRVTCINDNDENISDAVNSLKLNYVAESSDGKFLKLRLNLKWCSGILSSYSKKHIFSFDTFVIDTGRGSRMHKQNCRYEFDYSGEDVTIGYEQSEVATLDVHHTYYRTAATSGPRIVDEIHTVYFSIPDEYAKYYKHLYSVASTYIKKHTTPIFLSTLPFNPFDFEYSDDFIGPVSPIESNCGFISNNYTYDFITHYEPIAPGATGTILVTDFYYKGNVGYNLIDAGNKHYEVDNLITLKPQYYFNVDLDEVVEDEDLKITLETLLDYISYAEDNDLNKNLFDSSEKVEWSEKTIDDTFDSISYATKGDFSDISENYGWGVSVLLWFYQNNPSKVQEILEKYVVDTNYKDYINEPYLVLCDDKFKEESASLSDEDFSKKYLINIDDVSAFREYLNENDNVILYRYDVVPYYSESVSLILYDEDNYSSIISDEDKHGIVQQYLYFDFRVIDVTFNVDEQFISLCVNSHPQTVGGDPGIEEDAPPIVINPTLPGIDDLFDDKNDNIIKTVIRIALVITGVLFLAIGAKIGITELFSTKKNNSSDNSEKKNE